MMACARVRHNRPDCPSAQVPIELWCESCRHTFGARARTLTLDLKISKPLFDLRDHDAIEELAAAALDVVMDADLLDDEWYGKLVDPDKIDRLERAVEAVQRT